MGKMIISNHEDWMKKAFDYATNAGFSKYNIFSEKSKTIIFQKLRVDHCNFYTNGDYFVAVSGTFIYKEKYNEDGLMLLLKDYKNMVNTVTIEKVISSIRKNSVGNFFISIGSKEKYVCFIDEMGCYSFYYYCHKDKFLMTNTYFHIAKIIGAEPNKMGLYDKYTRGANCYNETPFLEVYRIMPDEYILIADQFQVKKCGVNYYGISANDDQTIIENLEIELRKLADIRNGLVMDLKTFVFLTGGVDSRLEMSLCTDSSGISVGYWTGDDTITNGTIPDAEISQKLANQKNCKFRLFDVGQDYSTMNDDIISDWKKYGEFANIYAHNRKWLNIPFELDDDISFIVYGYFGETLQNCGALDRSYKSDYTIYDFINRVYARCGMYGNVFKFEGLNEYINEQLKNLDRSFCEKEINYSNYDKLDYLNLFNRTRTHADMDTYNFINMFYYGFSLFSQKRVYDLVEMISDNAKENASLSLKITKLFDESLLNVDYFSHHQHKLYNKMSNSLESPKSDKFVDFCDALLKHTFLYEPIRRLAHMLKEKNKKTYADNMKLLKEINNYMHDSKFVQENIDDFIFPESTKGYTIEMYARLVTEIEMIDYARGDMKL